ncbi:phage endopeptidase [Proteus mirabilis]|uniref:Phage endopeptidase n=1 Tax=Proteus mirabilis TaxID=584 RepID=A0A379FGH4_PROMI|nr:phage endopeptidase [Proteus mirabilis]
MSWKPLIIIISFILALLITVAGGIYLLIDNSCTKDQVSLEKALSDSSLTSSVLIMKYGKLYAVITMVGIIVGGYWVVNWQANRINSLTDINKKLAVALEEQKSINTDYQARIMRLNQLDIQYTQELANAKNEISPLA